MARDDDSEIRFMAPVQDVRVLDGYCHGSGRDRTGTMREILHEWAERKLHEATMIVRVAGGNPTPPDGGRHGS
jgi:hypothetical protein